MLKEAFLGDGSTVGRFKSVDKVMAKSSIVSVLYNFNITLIPSVSSTMKEEGSVLECSYNTRKQWLASYKFSESDNT